METWTKLYASILDSSVWFESKEAKILWVTMLAAKNENGFVRGTMKSLANKAVLTEEECAAAIKILESPDKESRTRENQGRRVKRVDGGWEVLNHFLYRDEFGKEALREYWRRKKEESLKRKAAKVGATTHTQAERVMADAAKNGDEKSLRRAEEISDGVPPGSYSV